MQHFATWIGALVVLVGLGWSLGLNPALYGATADMLARGSRPFARLCSMVAGLFLGATVLFAVLQTINPQSFVSALKGKLDTALLNRTVDVVAGAVFLLLAVATVVWVLRQKTLPKREPKPPAPNAQYWSYFGIGLSSSVIGFTTLPIMYLTGRVVSSSSSELVPRVIAYAVFLLALASPFFAMVWVWGRFPRQSQRLSDFYTRALHRDYRQLFAALFAVAGVVFLALAVFVVR